SVCPMVDELTDRDSLRQFSHSAEVIAMPMRRYQMVNLLQLGILCGCNNAIGIARSGRAGVAGVNEERLALRGHQQGPNHAVHVYDRNMQFLFSAGLCMRKHEWKQH